MEDLIIYQKTWGRKERCFKRPVIRIMRIVNKKGSKSVRGYIYREAIDSLKLEKGDTIILYRKGSSIYIAAVPDGNTLKGYTISRHIDSIFTFSCSSVYTDQIIKDGFYEVLAGAMDDRIQMFSNELKYIGEKSTH